MFGALRLIVFGFLFLSVVYFVVSIYSRSVRREKLEKEWDQEVKSGDRDAYVTEGMKAYDKSLRKRLIWLVFVVPVVVFAAIFYLTNYA